MALTKLTADLDNIQALSDKPNEIEGLTADQLKAKFDKGANDIKDYINDTLIDELDTSITDIDTKTTLIANGWYGADETWTYASVDDPTGVITISGDKTTKYSLGMRIMFTNATNVIYGIITAISYSSPNTTLTFLHEIDPTDNQALYLMANSTITNNYYSSVKAPYGFPVSPAKWSVVTSSASEVVQSNPTTNTWYNLGSLSISIPIGVWKTHYTVNVLANRSTSGTAAVQTTLSTANNSQSNANLTAYIFSGPVIDVMQSVVRYDTLTLASKTTHYLNARSTVAGHAGIYFWGTTGTTIIRAECAYL
jgi:hypothetical protein